MSEKKTLTWFLEVRNRGLGGGVQMGAYGSREDAEAARTFIFTLLGFHREHDFYLQIEERWV